MTNYTFLVTVPASIIQFSRHAITRFSIKKHMEKHGDKDENMKEKEYELMYILPAKMSDEEKQSVIERVNKIVEKLEGTIKDHNTWMSRKLSYPIKHIRQGVYMLAHLSMPGESLNKLRRELDLDEDIIRHLLTSYDSSSKSQASTLRPMEIKPTTVKPQSENKETPEKEEKVSAKELDEKLEEILSEE